MSVKTAIDRSKDVVDIEVMRRIKRQRGRGATWPEFAQASGLLPKACR